MAPAPGDPVPALLSTVSPLCASGATLVKVCHACSSVTGDTSSSCLRAVYLLTRKKKKR